MSNRSPSTRRLRARTTWPGGYRNGCNADFDKTVPARCVFGVERRPTRRVALLGDSHAIQWFPALVPIAKAQGWALELDTKSACHPSDSVQYEANMGGAYTECVEWRTNLLNAWEADPSTRPDVVILAGRNYQDIDVDGAPLPKRESLTSLRDGMVRLLQRLDGMGIRAGDHRRHPGARASTFPSAWRSTPMTSTGVASTPTMPATG